MSSPPRAWPGKPYPLGATWDGAGVNFTLFSEHATAVELCFFDPADPRYEVARVPLRERTDQVWHAYVPDVGPGQLYGYRVHGPWEPRVGHRFDGAKVLLDPCARAIAGTPRCVVIDPSFPWGEDHLLRTPWNETVIYEVHVKGFTARHPGVPESLRGTYAGFVSPAPLDYLRSLGITAVELLPVHQSVSEEELVARGLTNYWGYNSIGFFAPDARYSSSGVRGEQVREFKAMVKALHQAAIEVILDVVYNHTAEGDHRGPTLCFRGIDNAAYYRLLPGDPSRYMDYTGCGNTLNMTHPRTLQLIMDSLRYWILEMHVDGFRFDLAAALARELHDVDRLSAFFDIIHQDPVISQVKLIAEPWDLGEGGYQVGNFPIGWAEWNAKFRDAIRRYWRGDGGQVAELAYRLTGSSDLYQDDARSPWASVNFVTSHDGFTLADLVSYKVKHNEANVDLRDGAAVDLSWNCGVEGPTADPAILALRERQRRNFLATLFVSQGVPMLCGGDEIGRTQRGNNNAYCQDNEISWFDWKLDEGAGRLLEFTRSLIRLRREHPELRRWKFFQGRPLCDANMKDLLWIRPDGGEIDEAEWRDVTLQAFGFRLCGVAMDDVNEHGEPITDDTLLVLLNASPEAIAFTLPDAHPGVRWEVVVDTREDGGAKQVLVDVGAILDVAGRSLALLRAVD